MNPDDLARILDELGQRLGPTGERVFELAVRQVWLDALGWGVFAALILGGCVWGWRLSGRVDDWDAGPLRAVCVVGFLMASWLLLWQITTVLNPEYAAIRNILEAVQP